MAKRRGSGKRLSGRQWGRYAVLAFCVIDGLGIYAAHVKLSQPVAESLLDDPVAIGATPRQLSPQVALSPQVQAPVLAHNDALAIQPHAEPPALAVSAKAETLAAITLTRQALVADRTLMARPMLNAPVLAADRRDIDPRAVQPRVSHHRHAAFAEAFADGAGMNAMPEPAFGRQAVNAPVETEQSGSAAVLAEGDEAERDRTAQAGAELPALADGTQPASSDAAPGNLQ